ncbi:MAG: SpaA isopeptide-forming pilin-related protein, partial [Lysinibacillus sp.]
SVAIQVTAQEEVVSEEATENDEVAASEESMEKAEKANEEEQESGSVATESEKSSDELGVSKEEKSSDELGVSKEEKSSDTTKAVSEDTEEKDSSSKASARDTQTYNHIDILLVAKDITFTLDGKKYSIPGTVIQDTLVVKSGSNTWTGSQFHKEKDPNRNDWEYRLTRISISSAATVDVSCKIELDTSKLSDEELAILKEHLEFDAQGRLTFEGTFDESDNVCGGKGSARGFDFEVSGTELGEYFTTGTIDIIKVDGDTVDSDSPVYLSGATFRLIDSNKKVVVIEGVTDSNGIITTDASGKASFTKVPYGTYTLEEVSPPDGYTLPSPGKWQVKISKDSKTQTVTVKNYTVGSLTIAKNVNGVDDEDNAGTFNFIVLDESGEQVKEGSIVYPGDKSLTFDDLPAGKYIILEEDPSGVYSETGYNYVNTTADVDGNAVTVRSVTKDDTKYMQVAEVAITSGGETTVTYTNTYSQKTGEITVNKTVTGISDDDKGVGEFTFTLLDKDGGTVATEKIDMSQGSSVTFTDVTPGTYTIVEQDPSGAYTGYALTGVQVNGKASDTFSTDDLTVSRGNSQEVTFTNNYSEKAGSITVNKEVNGVSKGLVKEGKFTYTLLDSNGEKVDELTVDMSTATSVTFTNVKPGTYTIVEQDPSGAYTGYALTGVQVNGKASDTFSTDDLTVSRGNSQEVKFTNVYEEKAGDITVTKDVQGVNKGDVKEGQFTFQLMKGEEVVQEKVVDMSKETSVTFEDVTPGTYTIVEKDPSGAYKGYTFSEVKVNGEAVSNPIAEDVKVSRGEGPTVAFTNVYEEKAGDITVTKDV